MGVASWKECLMPLIWKERFKEVCVTSFIEERLIMKQNLTEVFEDSETWIPG